jgi:uncharacterized protein YjeT (DUF2065 family)
MRSIAFADFLIGVGILFVLEGLLFAAIPSWMRRAMKSALATPDNMLRVVGIGSAVAGLMIRKSGSRSEKIMLKRKDTAEACSGSKNTAGSTAS